VIYAEYAPEMPGRANCIRVYSNVDSLTELNKFRCLVRAPSTALISAASKDERDHLLLFGNPCDVALRYLPPDRLYATPMDRVEWERTRIEIMKRHPHPFIAPLV
jgi:hypothetical protein